ncbi:hypothetical protein EIN_134270 [Entamoeba invadens IP1]|uniref:Uncharacterized protein n=1 Tax=Entamoeba invadens IP1 TaxID=370355 RepID=A0A0A1TX93_ENTIV|nr:hypothetical protein EIN_134270 [Entamoeba invadens IP1]ELP85893.1 hypothetical protein EIN_134270 [Entamoeba invadens IP1]|eukprot:XP_004185239.1 hypothetical protein EIN_134270 [Entamoeba invadens IP1]
MPAVTNTFECIITFAFPIIQLVAPFVSFRVVKDFNENNTKEGTIKAGLYNTAQHEEGSKEEVPITRRCINTIHGCKVIIGENGYNFLIPKSGNCDEMVELQMFEYALVKHKQLFDDWESLEDQNEKVLVVEGLISALKNLSGTPTPTELCEALESLRCESVLTFLEYQRKVIAEEERINETKRSDIQIDVDQIEQHASIGDFTIPTYTKVCLDTNEKYDESGLPLFDNTFRERLQRINEKKTNSFLQIKEQDSTYKNCFGCYKENTIEEENGIYNDNNRTLGLKTMEI